MMAQHNFSSFVPKMMLFIILVNHISISLSVEVLPIAIEQQLLETAKEQLEISRLIYNELKKPEDCADVKAGGASTSGKYSIYPGGKEMVVFCDMDTSDGGWTVFQKRQDGSVDFYRKWHDYEIGFGDIEGEFWLGLQNIHKLTSRKSYTLRVDLEDKVGGTAYAEYTKFSVLGEADEYMLHVGGYNGTAGDSLTRHNGMKFSTYDHDNDPASGSCAFYCHGAWWFEWCYDSQLNGGYFDETSEGGCYRGNVWKSFHGSGYSVPRAEMKIRPTKV